MVQQAVFPIKYSNMLTSLHETLLDSFRAYRVYMQSNYNIWIGYAIISTCYLGQESYPFMNKAF